MPKTINDIHDIPGIEGYIRPTTSSSSVAHGLDPSQIPDFNSVIWRYMDFAKLVSLLDKEALFFCRADQLGDPFEGAWSDPTLKVLRMDDSTQVKAHGDQISLYDVNENPVLRFNLSDFGENRPPDARIMVRAWQEMMLRTKDDARFTLINCWHENANESEAMWRLYASRGFGVAIKSSFGDLVKSFTSRLPDIIARVNYLRYDTMPMPLVVSAPFLHKRVSFEHEHEVRALITEHIESASATQPSRRKLVSNTFSYRAKDIDYSTDICDIGLYYGVDVRQLILEVVVSPYAPPWIVDLTFAVVKRYGFQFPVRPSDLAQKPRWD